MAYPIDDISDIALSPAGAASTIDNEGADWGIDGKFTGALSSLIIQNETFSDEPQVDQTYDQKNRLVHELTYDHIYTVTLDVIGLGDFTTEQKADLKPNAVVQYTPSGETSAEKWVVRKCDYQGAYNDKKKWSVTLERRAKFPGTGD